MSQISANDTLAVQSQGHIELVKISDLPLETAPTPDPLRWRSVLTYDELRAIPTQGFTRSVLVWCDQPDELYQFDPQASNTPDTPPNSIEPNDRANQAGRWERFAPQLNSVSVLELPILPTSPDPPSAGVVRLFVKQAPDLGPRVFLQQSDGTETILLAQGDFFGQQ